MTDRRISTQCRSPGEASVGPLEAQLACDDPAFTKWHRLQQQNDSLILKASVLLGQLARLQSQLNKQERYMKSSKPKKHRRSADQIIRTFSCSYCGKAYGLEGSLTQHCRLKHGNRGNGGENEAER